jgi:hypothetical protein
LWKNRKIFDAPSLENSEEVKFIPGKCEIMREE